jgi:uncharacterized protein
MLIPDLDLARRFVAAHPPPGTLVMCAVSGAHLYGFPSPDSDLDLKGIHLVPTRSLLGLRPVIGPHDLTEDYDGVECDLTTNEAGSSLASLLAGNGNMLERILSPHQLVRTTQLTELQHLARRSIGRHFLRHYSGFFRGCCREHERQPSAKTMLYAYRVALTGTHLLHTGELDANLSVLAPHYGFGDVDELIALKRRGTEHGDIDPALDAHHRARWPALDRHLAEADAASSLPERATNEADLEEWLIMQRQGLLA